MVFTETVKESTVGWALPTVRCFVAAPIGGQCPPYVCESIRKDMKNNLQ